jgi:hypothetical protein
MVPMIGGEHMDEQLQAIEKELKKRNFDSPALHLWHPPLSGDIPIVINADGAWYHDGGKIERESIVRLFASILRREEDGEYYLVTPGEKWRIEVTLHPLVVMDVERNAAGLLQLTLNTGKKVEAGQEHPLFLEPERGNVAGVKLDHGLSAIFSRAAWYRLVELSQESDGHHQLTSGDYLFRLDAGEEG